MEQKEQKKEERFELVEVPTETTIAFREKGSDKAISQLELMRRMANDIADIKARLNK